jgi:Zn-dependent protease
MNSRRNAGIPAFFFDRASPSATRRAFDEPEAVLQIFNTMFPSFRLGTLLGFPIRVNLSFLLLLLVVFIWMGGLPGLALALVTAGSVILHELGHALTARRLGVAVGNIELHFFGGAAQVAMPRSPREEILVAGAGPAVSFVLAALGLGLGLTTGVRAFVLFGAVNLLLAVFNLLPAFPSDGGRILRALLARKRGLVGATELAVKVGRVVCVALAITGLAMGSIQMVLVAAVLWMMGSAERLMARHRGDSGQWLGRGRGRESRLITDVEYIPPGSTRSAPSAASPAAPRIYLDGRGRVVVVRS